MPRHLLIDADVLAYQACTACEKATEWEDGYWTWHADEKETKKTFLDSVDSIMSRLDGSKYTLALTSSASFRKDILPTYKGNRDNIKKPLLLKHLREWLVEDKKAKMIFGLEGDDIVGLMATKPDTKEDRIIVSIDKDMKTIPGLLCSGGNKVIQISEPEADYWHMYQTLIGDVIDGYKGCPGVGTKKAHNMLTEAADEGDDMWPLVVASFKKAGLTEADALVQARVARILRHGEYNFETRKVNLWTP